MRYPRIAGDLIAATLRARDRMRRRAGVALVVFGVISASGCSGGHGGPPPQPPVKLQLTSTSLMATPGSPIAGAEVTLSAMVKVTSGSAASGTVGFEDSGTTIGSATLDATGAASLKLTTLGVGSHSITAKFAGTSSEAASTSGAIVVTVTAAPKLATLISDSQTGSLQFGAPLELSAWVSPAAGTGVPTGSVSFSEGSRTLATVPLDFTGRAITTVSNLPAGQHLVTVTYNGDMTFAGSSNSTLAPAIVAPPNPAYTNPLKLDLPNGGTAVSCADPAILKVKAGNTGADTWYLYCTSDALKAGDTAPHFINIFESTDLVTWMYDGDAFPGLPVWAPAGQLWAPAIKYFNGQYYLYYASPSSNQDALGGAAIGVGVSASPKGPFLDHGTPVVEPEPAGGNCCNGRDRSTIDPDVVQDASGQRYITFGSFDGGIFVRKLSADGFTSDKSSETQIGATNRYEGGAMWQHGSFWYLFASSSNCCNGPLTGYSVFVGRATTPLGPFVDRGSVSMAATNAGGEEVLAQNGDAWIGPGGNVVFTDESGQDYILYHAVESDAAVYAGSPGYTARPALLDTLDWDSAGWPHVDSGLGPSASPRSLPAAQPGAATIALPSDLSLSDMAGSAISSLSDEFNGASLSQQWTALHASPAYSFSNGSIQMPTVGLDSCCQMSALPMLVENAPQTDYMVETKITLNVPEGTGFNYAQGDLFLYGDDRNFLRLDLFASAGTRQIEFVKQTSATPAYAADTGYSNLSEPALQNGVTSAYLRIVKRTVNDEANYTAYSSQDGVEWHRGATWKHSLTNEKIGIAASNLPGFSASFDYVHVYTLQ